ncbi:P-protein [uncultured Roseburia sp.]|uniref:prephenate dehydratase n=1 Tax=Brotonthovivens ammoniilytica TaxID=2981725 RepID=A0ABT2TP57_9FIRM|nr:prephenate dehydratase domain-containing protein [Brotonthovivens ammoniilytica]MCU6763556.1 hypothetical protein [Brotonthovivens ammoniilytica]SCJ24933.1 P-protein [uncultured Roseburia sp.]
MKKIGYMGIPGSFSEIAARELAKQAEITDVSYIPLICARNILKELQQGTIDYGVLGVENSSAGPVSEFVETFSHIQYEHLETFVLPIHHCLFKLSAETPMEHLTEVASHPQALSQTQQTRAGNYPQLLEKEIEDTAIGAEWLAKGILPDTTAVICSIRAGQAWNLELVAENIEDSSTNRTTFWLLKLK